MAKDWNDTQSSLEERVYPIDWTKALLTDVTVTSVTITHTKPDNTVANPNVITSTTSSPTSYIKVPSGLDTGTHKVSCVATTSDTALSPEVRLIIRVDY